MLKGFRDFILRGNVVDLAVAFVIGSAFAALVKTITDSLLSPLINIFLGGGKNGGKFTVHGQDFLYGNVISAILAFLITAAVVYFFVVVPTHRILTRLQRGDSAPPVAVSEDLVVLREIRDLLRNQGLR